MLINLGSNTIRNCKQVIRYIEESTLCLILILLIGGDYDIRSLLLILRNMAFEYIDSRLVIIIVLWLHHEASGDVNSKY
jgi:hypothetical protein